MLDYAEKKYGRGFVADVKALKNCTYIFLPLPLFWALFDQQVTNNFCKHFLVHKSKWFVSYKKLDMIISKGIKVDIPSNQNEWRNFWIVYYLTRSNAGC